MKLASLTQKYLMAISGLILALFVLAHMLGNLLYFCGPDALNTYAYTLHHTLLGGPATLWIIRALLLIATLTHVVIIGIQLALDSRKGRGSPYGAYHRPARTLAARTMALSGILLIAFILFHILQFTVKIIPEAYTHTLPPTTLTLHGRTLQTFNVYAMLQKGLSHPAIALFYITAVASLGLHLSHGASSLFQSLGLRNRTWHPRLDTFAKIYGLLIFLGFASVPLAILLQNAPWN